MKERDSSEHIKLKFDAVIYMQRLSPIHVTVSFASAP